MATSLETIFITSNIRHMLHYSSWKYPGWHAQRNKSPFSVVATWYSVKRLSRSMIRVGFSGGHWPRFKFFKPLWLPLSSSQLHFLDGSRDSAKAAGIHSPLQCNVALNPSGREGSIILIILLRVLLHLAILCVSLSPWHLLVVNEETLVFNQSLE